MNQITVSELVERYNNGERDFREVTCKGATFDNLDLSGADFSGADLSHSNFKQSKLNNCNFSGANIEWSNFTEAEMKKIDLTRANAKYSSFNDAKLDDAVLTNVDMQYCVLFNVIMNFKDMSGANFHEAAWNESDLNKDAVDHVRTQLMAANGLIPSEVYLRSKFSVESVAKQERMNIDQGHRGGYGASFGIGGNGYGAAISTTGGYGAGSVSTGSAGYAGTNTATANGYGR